MNGTVGTSTCCMRSRRRQTNSTGIERRLIADLQADNAFNVPGIVYDDGFYQGSINQVKHSCPAIVRSASSHRAAGNKSRLPKTSQIERVGFQTLNSGTSNVIYHAGLYYWLRREVLILLARNPRICNKSIHRPSGRNPIRSQYLVVCRNRGGLLREPDLSKNT